jgi:catechol 2,3-dioxygenase-like lactoylglutathione lyase family enzyme
VLDHLTLRVSNFDRSREFYLAALEPIGYVSVTEITREQVPSLSVSRTIGLGVGGKPDLWLAPSDAIAPTHVALRAKTRAEVDAFHAAALAAGAKDNGAPGIRAHYHPDYYGAFVLDPDGYNLEVVCHDPA